ncbi:MAG: hypothetical protein KDA21_00270 [Phycisphaerales bacterium]|nr:hypothetical protein [Phycisphaerales bacterium]
MSRGRALHVGLLLAAAAILLFDGAGDLLALTGVTPMDASDAAKSTARVVLMATLEIGVALYAMVRWRVLVPTQGAVRP